MRVTALLGLFIWLQLTAFSQSVIAPAPFGKYTENINGVTLELVRIPQGSFMMGNDRSPNPEEKPAHQVNLRTYYMGQYEITRQQWNIVAKNLPKISRTLEEMYIGTGYSWNFEEMTPADFMFWDDAVEFCDRLSRFTGRKYRLPSEAEWELLAEPELKRSIRSATKLISSWRILEIFQPTFLPLSGYCQLVKKVTQTLGGYLICMGMLVSGV